MNRLLDKPVEPRRAFTEGSSASRELSAQPHTDAKSDTLTQPLSELTVRLRFLNYAIGALLCILLVAVGYRQLVRTDDYTALAVRQSQRLVFTPAPRGVIYDREHRVLARNRLRTDVVIDLGDLRHEFTARARAAVVQRHMNRVSILIGRGATTIDSVQLERHFARDRLTPFGLIADLTSAEIARLTPSLTSTDPIRFDHSYQRSYPHASAAAHALGRVRSERIRTPVGEKFPLLDYSDTRGDSGLEKQYDARLRSRPAETILQIDAMGFAVGVPRPHRDATRGEDLVVSIDLDLQLAAEKAMDATPGIPRGATVAISVATGEVLALASKPDFDLNTVSPALTTATWQQIDSTGGWFNRATQGLYPPGSSFKIFTMLAGLRSDTLQPDTTYRCEGFLQIGDRRFPCHHAAGHGDLTLSTALAHSCNVFAYQTGLAAGPAALAAEARRFHFNEPTGIDLPSEATRMRVPDTEWKKSAALGPWTDGDTANLAIGQGFLRVSPLQAACAMASLARRETLTVPTFLHQPSRRPSGDRAPEQLAISESDYTALIDAMKAVVETGIGRDAQVPGIKIAGKTGTAQVLRPEGMKNIAWFLAFAPAENPEIAVAVAMEGNDAGAEFAGARYAAPIAREILGAYFDKHPRL